MLGLKRKRRDGGPFLFRVSDVVDVPLRGIMVRLRRVDGQPAVDDLAVGSELLLRAPDGEERVVRIAAHAVTGGRQTQERLDRTGEFDVVLEPEADDVTPVEIGWMATRPGD